MMAPKFSPFIDQNNGLINVYVEAELYQYSTKKAFDDNKKICSYLIKNGFISHMKKNQVSVICPARFRLWYFCHRIYYQTFNYKVETSDTLDKY